MVFKKGFEYDCPAQHWAQGGPMTAVQSAGVVSGPGNAARRTGYGAAIAVNLIILFITNHLLEWGWIPFLTADFERILGLINLSVATTIAVNVVWMGYDAEWFKSLAQIGLNLIAGVVAIRTYQVFPFDFSTYEFDWVPIARLLIIVGILGIALATVSELVKLARSAVQALD
jgi:hypothetical protein